MAIVLNPQYAVTISRPVRPNTDGRSARHPSMRSHPSRQARHVSRPSDEVFRRRRMLAVALLITFAAAVCLGVRALASRGDVSASIPTVTPLGSSVLYTEVALDSAGAFVQGPEYYVVQEGDTIWSIASSLLATSSASGDIRSLVRELIALNGQASIDVGQRLALPAE